MESKNYENVNFLWTQTKKTDFFVNMQQLKRPKSTSSSKKINKVKNDDFIFLNP